MQSFMTCIPHQGSELGVSSFGFTEYSKRTRRCGCHRGRIYWVCYLYEVIARCFSFAGVLPPRPRCRPVRLTFNLIYFIEQPGSNAHPWATNLSSTSSAFRSCIGNCSMRFSITYVHVGKNKTISALLTPKLISVRFC